MNKANFDLNLLRVFNAVWEQRNVSRAAEALGVSQPTVSHALRALREHYRDRLYVRVPGGVMPTPIGEEVARRIGKALEVLEQGVDVQDSFDIESSRREFAIVMTDIAEAIILPRILSQCRIAAPHVAFRGVQISSENMVTALRDGTVNAVVGFNPALRQSLLHSPLFRSEYVTICSATHPRIRGALAREDFIRERHAVAQAQGTGHHTVESAIQRLGLLDSVGARVPHFHALPSIVAASDMIATIPRPLAELMLPVAPIKIFPAPIKLPKLVVEQFWHERFHDDSASRWLRNIVAVAVRDIIVSGRKGFAAAQR